jgi:hypothetical protein
VNELEELNVKSWRQKIKISMSSWGPRFLKAHKTCSKKDQKMPIKMEPSGRGCCDMNWIQLDSESERLQIT